MENPNGPPTERQLARLNWAARKLRKPLPIGLTKIRASELIDEWFSEDDELEEGWQAEKGRIQETQESEDDLYVQIEMALSAAEDWREMHHCKKVSTENARQVIKAIGPRRAGEPIDTFMRRFFSHLKTIRPELFSGSPVEVAPQASSPEPNKGGCVMLLLVVGILCILALFSPPKTLNVHFPDCNDPSSTFWRPLIFRPALLSHDLNAAGLNPTMQPIRTFVCNRINLAPHGFWTIQ